MVPNVFATLFRFEHNGSLKDRLLTALIVLTVAVVLSYLAITLPYGGLITVGCMGCVAVLSVFEVVRLFAREHDTLRYRPVVGVLLFAILAAPSLVAIVTAIRLVQGEPISWQPLMCALLVSAQALIWYHVISGRHSLDRAAHEAGRYGPAFLLLGVCAPQLVILGGIPCGVQIVWWLVAVVALNDAGAYFVGRAIGRNKMAPALSPNKTIEGSVAGLAIGTAAGVLFWRVLVGVEVGVFGLIVTSLAATLAGQAADLSKSYLKRIRGVKDTGAFFPGHGGVLDRFDGMIGAAPVVVLALMAWGLV